MTSKTETNALMEAINSTDEFDDDVFCTRELANIMGVSKTCVRQHVSQMSDEGKVEFAGHKESKDITGRTCQIPVYRVVKGD